MYLPFTVKETSPGNNKLIIKLPEVPWTKKRQERQNWETNRQEGKLGHGILNPKAPSMLLKKKKKRKKYLYIYYKKEWVIKKLEVERIFGCDRNFTSIIQILNLF